MELKLLRQRNPDEPVNVRDLRQTSKSELKDGIEAVTVMVLHPPLAEGFLSNVPFGQEYVVDWTLANLGRQNEIGRVCGFVVLSPDPLTLRVELRQPGKQFEKFLEESHGESFFCSTLSEDGLRLQTQDGRGVTISARALGANARQRNDPGLRESTSRPA